MADLKTYRHKVTGLLSRLEAKTAAAFGDIFDEVSDDAKPLAYTPIPDAAIADVQAQSGDASVPEVESGETH